FRGNVFVGEVANNLVYRAKLEPKGLGWSAVRAEQGREFLASKDVWFRPVQFANGPDGCLYVVDMYRELIEGAAFLPPQLLTSGQVIPALGDPDPRVREHALRLSEGFGLSAGLANRLGAIVDDPDRRVRYQLAFTLGAFPGELSAKALALLARRDAPDPWVR